MTVTTTNEPIYTCMEKWHQQMAMLEQMQPPA